jgi:MFS superfamily sulfate permease-like transporter
MPIVDTLRRYSGEWFTPDLAAAITVWAIVVPESMAYASIAGMPPETGLYAASVPLLLYALFGSSRRITVGPSAAVAALSLTTVAGFAQVGSEEFVGLTVLLTLMVGVILVLGGLAKLGVIADFLSEPVLKGFIVGVALTIALGQLGKIFGVEVEGEGFFADLERWMPRIPAALVVVVASILAVKGFDLAAAGVHVAGEIPAGLPSLTVPTLNLQTISALVPGAIGIAIVVYGESMALSKTFGSKHHERDDPNQEMVALGAANAAGGFFGAFVTTASNSRTAAADGAGQETQVSSLMVVLLVGVTLLFLTDLFADLPEAALGAIVVHAVAGLIRVRPISRLRSRNRVDFWAAVATLVGVLVLDVLAGLMIGVLVSLAGLMSRAVRPRITWLSWDQETNRLVDREEVDEREKAEVSIVRFGAELFFANAGTLRDAVVDEIAGADLKAVVLDAEAVTQVDTTAADEIMKLDDELARSGVRLVFARLQPQVREAIESGGLDLQDRDYARVADALSAQE